MVRLLLLCSRSSLRDFLQERERVAVRDEGRGQVLLFTHLTVGLGNDAVGPVIQTFHTGPYAWLSCRRWW